MGSYFMPRTVVRSLGQPRQVILSNVEGADFKRGLGPDDFVEELPPFRPNNRPSVRLP